MDVERKEVLYTEAQLNNVGSSKLHVCCAYLRGASASSDSGDFSGILGDKNRQFVQVIKSLILVIKVSYTDLVTQEIKTF
jgi:hypothetical protein